jgi:hypothetical protein
MVNGKTKDKQVIANLIIGATLLAGITVLIIFIPCPSSSQYIFFRFALSLAIASLSALLMGHISIKYKNIIVAGGSFAIFLLTLRYTPDLIDTQEKCSSFSYTFFLTDSTNSRLPELKGKLGLKLTNDIREETINDKGIVEFKNMPYSFSNTHATIELFVDGFWFSDSKSRATKIVLQGASTTLHLIADNTLCCVNGIVFNGRKVLAEVSITVDGMPGQTFHSDSKGTFNIVFPSQARKETQVLTFSKEGYIDKRREFFPGTQQSVSILLNQE